MQRQQLSGRQKIRRLDGTGHEMDRKGLAVAYGNRKKVFSEEAAGASGGLFEKGDRAGVSLYASGSANPKKQ